ncbi:hypothetical protein BC829DRAFT_388500 [Chytridium lagenaria]|nr:hypothetical protein BC829DRAFT_388500 [Chytridium lagenaria]
MHQSQHPPPHHQHPNSNTLRKTKHPHTPFHIHATHRHPNGSRYTSARWNSHRPPHTHASPYNVKHPHADPERCQPRHDSGWGGIVGALTMTECGYGGTCDVDDAEEG